MLSKVKKIFFVGVFGLLYVSFIAQFIYVILQLWNNLDSAFIMLGLMSIEWLVLISARYLSKKSAGSRDNNSSGQRHFRR